MTQIPETWLCRAREAERLALIAHVSPDGDTLGAALALRLAFLSLGKSADVICDGNVPENMRFLEGAEAVIRPEDVSGSYDTAMAVDVSDRRMMGKAEAVFDSARVRLVIDHHETNPSFADENFIRRGECACCLLAYEAILALGVCMTRQMGDCLMLGLSTDTGHFQYGYTSAAAFEAAGALRRLGVDVSDITRRLYRSQPMSRVRLTRIAYQKMHFECNDRIGVIELTAKDFDESGCSPHETGGLVNLALEVEGVRMALLACERDGAIKCSLRCVEPDTVNDIAARFGGGGHAQAAGLTLHMPIDKAVSVVLTAMEEKL